MGFIRRMFIGDPGDPTELDFLPLNTTPKKIETPTVDQPKKVSTPPDWEMKMVEARRKLGRPFKAQTKAPRIAEPSRDLEYLNDQTEIAKRTANVSQLDERRLRK